MNSKQNIKRAISLTAAAALIFSMSMGFAFGSPANEQPSKSRAAQASSSKDRVKANKAIAKISVIPKKIKLTDSKIIDEARKFYDSLNSSQKRMVSNHKILEEAEKYMAKLQVSKTIKAIDSLPDPEKIKLEDKDEVDNASRLYDSLDKKQAKLVDNYGKLKAAAEAVNELQAVKNVVDAIGKLPKIADITDESFDADTEAAEGARALYDALGESQKKLVANFNVLEALEVELGIDPTADSASEEADVVYTVQEVIKSIASLPAPSRVTENDVDNIDEARAMYDSLDEGDQSKVTNYKALVAAEDALSLLLGTEE